MNIGRWQFILWRRWAWHPPHRVVEAPLDYIYDILGQVGPLEISALQGPFQAANPQHKQPLAG